MLLSKPNILVAVISLALPWIGRAQLNGTEPIPPVAVSLPPPAQAAGPSRVMHTAQLDWSISSKTRDSQDWNAVEVITDLATGQQQERPKRFVEIGTGMNYQDQNGQWQPTREEFRLTRDGFAVAEFGPHMLIVGNNINAPDAIDFLSSDGKRFRSAPLAVAYFDPLTGRNVILATIRDTAGELTGPNVVTFRSAFEGLDASIRITYRRAGMSSDLILHEVPPDPALFGLSPQSHLELYTEFVESPAPGISERVLREEKDPDRRKALKQPGFMDQILDYGEYKIGTGAAFEINAEPNASKIPVGKRLEVIEGRTILIEAVEHDEAKKLLAGLPVRDDLLRVGRQPIMAAAARATAVESRTFPQRAVAHLPQKAIERAAIEYNPKNAFVLDYSLLTGATNFTFKCDTTYYVSSEVLLYGTTVLEHAVVKATNWTTYNRIQLKGPIQCLTGPYRPIVFTSMHDNSVGEILPWSTGNPITNYYGNPTLEVDYYTSGQLAKLEHIRISYAAGGISFFGGTSSGNGHVLSHAQFMHTQVPIYVYYNDISARNILVYQADRVAGPSATAVVRFEHLTAHQANHLNNVTNATIYLTNSILAHITNSPVYIGSNNATTNSSAFQTVGGGRHYLATNTLRNIGTYTINLQLLAELQTMTTYPPIVYSNVTISIPTTLPPRAQRDTDTPDLGYHYAPLDYAFGGSHANSNLTFTAGTAVGWFRTTNGWFHAGHGLHMADRQIVTFEGEPTKPNYWVRCSVAQEGGTGLWDGGFGPGGITSWADQNLKDVTLAAEIRARFTRFSVLASDSFAFRDDWGYLTVRLTDCEFWGGGCGGYVLSAYLTNCLMERTLVAQVAGWTNCQFHLRNTTFKGGSFVITRTSGPIPVSARDCAFDGTAMNVNDAYASNPTWTDYDYNAFLTGGPYTTPTGAHDVLVSSFNWQTGPLGRFYLWTNSPPPLINAGSVTANTRGLYHYTMSISQVKETNSVVDIGYHYMALNGYNQPIDTDGDLVPDWQEDVNGNGTVDAGESSWTAVTSDNDGDGLTNSQEINLGTNPVRKDTDGNGVPDGNEDYDLDLLSNQAEYNVPYNSDPKIPNSKNVNSSDSFFFHGGPVGSPVNVVYIALPPTFPPPDNIRWELRNAPVGTVWMMYYTPNLNPGFKWRPFDEGNTPTTTEFINVNPDPMGTAFFQAGVSSTDSDLDGLSDGHEVIISKTTLNNPDTDGDDYSDGPLKPGALAPSGRPWLGANDAFPRDPAAAVDTDGDGKPDDWLPGMFSGDLILDDDDDNDGVLDQYETPAGSKDPFSLPTPTWFVNPAPVPAPGTRDGSKALPYATIQDALNAAAATEYQVIQVERGIYCGTGNQNIDFLGKRVILTALRGPEETVIDLGSTTDCDGTALCTAAPAGTYAFNFHTSETSDSRVIGFTIRNAPTSAIRCDSASPLFLNCVITNNATVAGSGNGGAFNLNNASPTILNCRMVNNGNSSALGGAIYCAGASLPSISHCTLTNNTKTTSGGHIYARDTSKVTLNNAVVWSSIVDTELRAISPATYTVSYSDVRGGSVGIFNRNIDPILEIGGRMTRTSPAVDRGTTNTYLGYDLITGSDADGEGRLQIQPANILFSADQGSDEFVFRLPFLTGATPEPVAKLRADGSVYECFPIVSQVDEASGVSFLGNDGSGRAVIAVIDDEIEDAFLIYTLNAAGDGIDAASVISTLNPAYTGGDRQLLDLEGIAYNSASRELYITSSNTKRRRYRDVENTLIDPMVFSPTNDYDRRRNVLAKFTVNTDLVSVDTLATRFYEPENTVYPNNVYFNPTRGLIATMRANMNSAPYTAQTLGSSVLIAYNTVARFGTPVNGTAYPSSSAIPGGGTSLGTFASGTSTFDHTGRTANTDYYYKMWIVGTGNIYYEFLTAGARTKSYPDIFINEFVAESTTGFVDWIELFNPTTVAIPLTNYRIKCMAAGATSGGTETIFNNSPPTLPASGYLRLNADGAATPSGVELNFKLSKDGEQIMLRSPALDVIDHWVFGGGQRNNQSEGRAWDGGPSGRQARPGVQNQEREATPYQAIGAALLPTTSASANHITDRNSFIAASGLNNTIIYLSWRFRQTSPAVWDYSPKLHDFHALNIEGLAHRSATEMIIGLRSPLSTDRKTGNALYFRVTDVATFLPSGGGWAAAATGLTGPQQLNLNNQGIRSIEWCPGISGGRYLIIGGPANGGPLEKELVGEKFSLYSWNGVNGTAPTRLIEDLRPYTVRPEGVSVITVGGQTRVLFVEDRFLAQGYGARNAIHWPVSILGTVP
jgi:hypothetical protein